MLNVETLYPLCSVLLIIGAVLLAFQKHLPSYTGAFISVTGFAAIVRVFLPIPGSQDVLTIVTAFAGFVFIFWGAWIAKAS